MIIERLDVFEYKLILTEAEFNQLKFIADTEHRDIEYCLIIAIEDLLNPEFEDEPKGIN